MSLTLVRPEAAYAGDIAAYRAETLAIEPSLHGGCELARYDDPAAWIAHCVAAGDPALVSPDWVPSDEWLLVDSGDPGRILGLVNIRRHLGVPAVAEHDGHLGYSVRPGERGRGLGQAQLCLALAKCRELGIDSVLLTCETGNEASRRTIIACGGVFERTTTEHEDGVDHLMERYWISPRVDEALGVGGA
ncbi:MAG: GNAT family N-acetyltransferase [Propionibacteriaceae bacterium]|nr:GNAT family N-acetyltransferase [Propionibacteriaceae bacterium]